MDRFKENAATSPHAKEISDQLRPYFPYRVLEDSELHLRLKRIDSTTKVFWLLSAVSNLLAYLIIPNIVFLLSAMVSMLSIALMMISDGPSDLTITPTSISVRWKLLFLSWQRTYDRLAIETVTVKIKFRKHFHHFGRIGIMMRDGSVSYVMNIARSSQDDLRSDTKHILMRVSKVLALDVQSIAGYNDVQ
jgi:hypothetical protein